MPEMTEERLAEIEARANAATRGPWKMWSGWGPVAGTEYMAVTRLGPEGDEYAGIVSDAHYPPKRDFYSKREDLEFVAVARTDMPDLIAEVRRLRADHDRSMDALAQEADQRLVDAFQVMDALKEESALKDAEIVWLRGALERISGYLGEGEETDDYAYALGGCQGIAHAALVLADIAKERRQVNDAREDADPIDVELSRNADRFAREGY